MKRKGLFVLDTTGGSEVVALQKETKRYHGSVYTWECTSFNPITNRCCFAIHFKRPGERTRKNAFTYDWRLWSMAEVREMLTESGFSKTIVYWEKDDGKGGGSGEFYPTEKAEECESWIASIAALP